MKDPLKDEYLLPDIISSTVSSGKTELRCEMLMRNGLALLHGRFACSDGFDLNDDPEPRISR